VFRFSAACPPLADEGKIRNYQVVEPDKGWSTQYELDNADVTITNSACNVKAVASLSTQATRHRQTLVAAIVLRPTETRYVAQ